MVNPIHRRKRAKDWRTRRDRTRKHTEAFEKQIDHIVKAYMAWAFQEAEGRLPDGNDNEDEQDGQDCRSTYAVKVVDMFGKKFGNSSKQCTET